VAPQQPKLTRFRQHYSSPARRKYLNVISGGKYPEIITINVPLFKKLRDILIWDNLRGQKSLGPLKMSLEITHKVIVPQKKN
jgi:hypothetical protein